MTGRVLSFSTCLAMVCALPILRAAERTSASDLGIKSAHELRLQLSNIVEQVSTREGLALAEQVLEWDSKIVARDPAETASLYMELGRFLEDEDESGQAKDSYSRALQIREEHFGKESLPALKSAQLLSDVCYFRGDWEESVPLRERIADFYRATYGVTNLNTAFALRSLADSYARLKEYDKAEPLYRQALAVYEDQLGATNANARFVKRSLIEVLAGSGSHAEALQFQKTLQDSIEAQYGPQHEMTGFALQESAKLLTRVGQYSRAKPLFDRAIPIVESARGSTNHATLSLKLDAARCCIDSRSYDQAEKLLKQVAEQPFIPSLTREGITLDVALRELCELYARLQQFDKSATIAHRLLLQDRTLRQQSSQAVAEADLVSRAMTSRWFLERWLNRSRLAGAPVDACLEEVLLWKGSSMIHQLQNRRWRLEATTNGTGIIAQQLRELELVNSQLAHHAISMARNIKIDASQEKTLKKLSVRKAAAERALERRFARWTSTNAPAVATVGTIRAALSN